MDTPRFLKTAKVYVLAAWRTLLSIPQDIHIARHWPTDTRIISAGFLRTMGSEIKMTWCIEVGEAYEEVFPVVTSPIPPAQSISPQGWCEGDRVQDATVPGGAV